MTKSVEFEESLDELDQPDANPVNFWERKQRELLTSVVDYNLKSLAELASPDGTISLSPEYQRRLRWDEKRQSKLVESFLMNVPIPPVFLNEDDYGKYSVIDGKQRISAITAFMRGRLKLTDLDVFEDLNGKTFDELPVELRRVLETRPTLRAIIILRQSDRDIKYEVFRRLNTGGVRLNAQEIRNSVYPGPLNDLIMKLSEHKLFHRLLGIRQKSTSVIWQEMRDAEFVLRFLAFRSSWSEFGGGMRRHMDRYMDDNRAATADVLTAAHNDFLQTLEIVDVLFGEHAFQRWLPEKGRWRKQVIASLFDAQMFACRGRRIEDADGKSEPVLNAMKALFVDAAFRRTIDAATNTPTLFKERIQAVNRLLDKHL